MSEERQFEAEVNSRFEPILMARVFEPLLAYLPRSIAPNTISWLGHLGAWMTLALAYGSTLRVTPLERGLLILGVALGNFATMTADCLDGMQARRTGRTSRFGEFLDHWLDTINAPIVSAGLLLAVHLEPAVAVAFHITATGIYNAQLVLYHKSGRFVHPPTSGVDAQFGTSIAYLGIALYMALWGPKLWVNRVLFGLATLMQLRLSAFYYVRLRREVWRHFLFIGVSAIAGGVYLLGGMNQITFALMIVFLSLRITGAWVQSTLLKKDYFGLDLVAFLALTGSLVQKLTGVDISLASFPLATYLPYGTLAYLFVRAWIDFMVHLPEFRPSQVA